MSGIISKFRRQQGIDGNTTECGTNINAGYCTKLFGVFWFLRFFEQMNKQPHKTVSVDKYTRPAMSCATELNTAAQKRKVEMGYTAVSYNSEDNTGHSKMSNWLLVLYFSFKFYICSQALRWTLKCFANIRKFFSCVRSCYGGNAIPLI